MNIVDKFLMQIAILFNLSFCVLCNDRVILPSNISNEFNIYKVHSVGRVLVCVGAVQDIFYEYDTHIVPGKVIRDKIEKIMLDTLNIDRDRDAPVYQILVCLLDQYDPNDPLGKQLSYYEAKKHINDVLLMFYLIER